MDPSDLPCDGGHSTHQRRIGALGQLQVPGLHVDQQLGMALEEPAWAHHPQGAGIEPHGGRAQPPQAPCARHEHHDEPHGTGQPVPAATGDIGRRGGRPRTPLRVHHPQGKDGASGHHGQAHEPVEEATAEGQRGRGSQAGQHRSGQRDQRNGEPAQTDGGHHRHAPGGRQDRERPHGGQDGVHSGGAGGGPWPSTWSPVPRRTEVRPSGPTEVATTRVPRHASGPDASLRSVSTTWA